MSQSHFTLSFPLKAPSDAKVLAEQPLMPVLFQAADNIGTIHYSRFTVPHFAQFVPLEDNQIGFFTVYDGVPLALSPETDSPPGGIPPEQLNNFEYVNTDGSGDPKGLRCPVGAHIRRINPRGQPVTGQGQPGGSNDTHRLIRRGMPYGPAYDPTQPYDGIERGLLGYFINSSIENQYEFVLGQWVNDSEFKAPRLSNPSGDGAVRLHPKSKDPLIGTQDPTQSIFVIPQAESAPPCRTS